MSCGETDGIVSPVDSRTPNSPPTFVGFHTPIRFRCGSFTAWRVCVLLPLSSPRTIAPKNGIGSSRMANTYFFWTPADRKPGHIFPAGNHGKVISSYPHLTANATNGWKLAIEQTLEIVRLTEMPDKPSRLLSAFAFLSESDALARAQFDASSKLYEVEPVDPAAPNHVADFDLYDSICKSNPSQSFLPKTRLLARQYWSGGGTGIKEFLTESDLMLIRRIK